VAYLFTVTYTFWKIWTKVHSSSLFEYIIEERYIKEEIQNFHYTPLNKYFILSCVFFPDIYMLYRRFIYKDGFSLGFYLYVVLQIYSQQWLCSHYGFDQWKHWCSYFLFSILWENYVHTLINKVIFLMEGVKTPSKCSRRMGPHSS